MFVSVNISLLCKLPPMSHPLLGINTKEAKSVTCFSSIAGLTIDDPDLIAKLHVMAFSLMSRVYM